MMTCKPGDLYNEIMSGQTCKRKRQMGSNQPCEQAYE